MFTVTYAQLNVWLTAFLWPFVRILALVATAPLIGHASVPARVKIGVSALVSIAVAPALGPLPQATVFSAEGIWILVNQFLIGAALGFTMQIVFAVVEAAGDYIGLQMGLGFASFFDPHSGNTPMLGRVLNAFAMLAFIAFDGHLQLIAALVQSFDIVPISSNLLRAAGWRIVAGAGINVFSMGLLLALPVVAVSASWRARRLPCQARPYFSSASATVRSPTSALSTSRFSARPCGPSVTASGNRARSRSRLSAARSAER
ncbi:flagellar biosynthetic protein FliR, partial [Burkholderia gladioli]|nr:flagellar biosynthetic protein FliR [Burkholderia gladioli]